MQVLFLAYGLVLLQEPIGHIPAYFTEPDRHNLIYLQSQSGQLVFPGQDLLEKLGTTKGLSLRLDGQTAALFHYMVGPPAEWQLGLKTFRHLILDASGLELKLTGFQNALRAEWTFLNAQGEENGILLFEHGQVISLDKTGWLELEVQGQRVRISPPEVKGLELNVEAKNKVGFKLKDGKVSFELPFSKEFQPFSLSSTLIWSSVFGDDTDDTITDFQKDGAGNFLLAGSIQSALFWPLTVGTRGNKSFGRDAFLTKLNSSGTAPMWTSLLGGYGHDEIKAFALMTDGTIWAVGTTSSNNFPVTDGSTFQGYYDGFLLHLASDGSVLYASTFGGMQTETPKCIRISGSTLWIAGSTRSTNFPTTANALDSVLSGSEDGFILAANSTSGAIQFASFWGGSDSDEINALDLDGAGNIYFGGETRSTDFPTTTGVFSRSMAGAGDAFLTKISPGLGLVYSTYLGGTGIDSIQDLILVPGNEVLMTGQASNSFPTTPGVYKPISDYRDAFVVQINATASSLTFATALGGSNMELGQRVMLVGNQILVAGSTESVNFPAMGQQHHGASDIFVAYLNANGTQLLNAQLLGGADYDFLNSTRIHNGKILLAGKTFSNDFPVSNDGLMTQMRGSSDGFFSVLSASLAQEYSSFLGGEGFDAARDAVSDSNGNIILCGYTTSDLFPVTVTSPNFFPDLAADVVVSKVSADGTQLLFSSRIGGNGNDYGRQIALDTMGDIYVAGETSSSDFPVTSGAFDTSYGGNGDGFVLKLSSTGDSLKFSTYLGSSGWDQLLGLKLKGQLAIVVGATNDASFPTTAGAISQTLSGGTDAYLSVLNTTGSSLSYSTFLGGSGSDIGFDVALDSSDNIYVLGHTTSSNFPTVSGCYDVTHNGEQDIFLTRISSVGTLTRSTFLGGSQNDQGQHLVMSSDGPIIAGWSQSLDFPTLNAWQTTQKGSLDVVLAKFNAQLTALSFSTYLGGTSLDSPTCLALDSSGRIWVGGQTSSSSFPTSSGPMQNQLGGLYDMFLHQFSANGSQLVYGSYFGGSGTESCAAILPRPDGSLSVVGSSNTPDFPITPGAYTSYYSGGMDIVVAQICPVQKPGPINGPQEVCGSGSVIYSISALPGISIYNWSVPSGATIISGQTTTSISVQLNGHPGTISVKAMGTCGESDPSSIEVTFPPALGSIGTIQGDSSFCPNELKQYNIAPVTNATHYQWNLPMGTTIVSGQGTTTLTAMMVSSGDIVVEASNTCGQKLSDPKAVIAIQTIGSIGPITGSGPYCPETGGYTFSVTPVSGATHYEWSLPVGAVMTSGAGTSSIKVTFGLGYGNLSVVASNPCGSTSPASIYLDFSDILNIYQQPETQISCVGQRAEFSVDIEGSQPLQLTWYKDGIPLNQHAETLVIDPVSEGDEGSYQCRAETPCVSEFSAAAYLVVGGIPKVQLLPSHTALGLRDPEFQLDLTCETPPFSLEWSTSPTTPYLDLGASIRLQPAPAVSTQIDCTFTDSGGSGPIPVHGLLLVAQNPAFLDLNADGCNNLLDLWLLAQNWRTVMNQDADGDHWIDIRDFLYLNLDDPVNCP
ncbi:MAG: SBBP repeat-containing protein [Acidobacteria bacterium]|nr:SBBP repeat-containing protein [Acidobacteriota bacterium]MCB9398540.1 SBBP repeat-containing protein [Acidobacteriota bacterium]